MKKILFFLAALLFSIVSRAQKVPVVSEQVRLQPYSWPNTPQAKTTSVNSCDTWTFQLLLSSSRNENPADAIHLLSNNYIICGSDSAATGVRGRLIKLGSNGGVLLSKAFTLAGQQVRIHKTRLFSNGKLYAIGTALEPISMNAVPLLLCIDTSNFALLHAWQIQQNGATTNWKGVDLNEGRDNNFFVLFHNDSQINVTKINHTSNSVLWSKTYLPRNNPRPVGIGVEYNDVYVAWNETDSGFSKAVIMVLANGTGNYKFGSRAGGRADNTDIQLQSITMINLRPRITALQRKDNQYQLIRMNYDPAAYPSAKEVFSVVSLAVTQDLRSQQDDWGQRLAVQSQPSNSIDLIDTYPDNYRSPIRSWQLNYNEPVVLRRLIGTNDGGSLVVANNAAHRIVLTKTDSAATLPGCTVYSQPASFQEVQQPFKADTIQQAANSLQLISANLSVEDVSLSETVDCRSIYCPQPPQPDSCLRTFFKEYRNTTNSIVSSNVIDNGSGKFLLQSFPRSTPYVALEQTQFTVLDTAGRLLESRMLMSSQPLIVYNLTKLKDGNLLGTGVVRNGDNPSDIFLFKFRPDFSILWQKKLITTSAPHFNSIAAIMVSSEGDIYCYLTDRITQNSETRTILKLNAAGNPVWMKQYSIGPTIFPQSHENNASLVEFEDAIVVKYNEEDGDFSPHLMLIRKTDGVPVWVKKYQMRGPYNGSNSFILRALVTDGRYIYMSGISQNENVLLKISADGSVVLAKRTPAGSVSLGWMGLKTGGRLLTSVSSYSAGGYVNGVVEMDTNFVILRSQFMKVPRNGRNGALIPFSDSVTYSAGSLWHENPYWASLYFQKYNFNSSFASCAVDDLLLSFNNFQQTVTAKQVSEVTLTPPQTMPLNIFYETAHLAYSGYYCGNNTNCSKLEINGPALICDTATTYSFNAKLNNDCKGNVLWQMDTIAGQLQIVSMTDTLVKLQVRKSGSFSLRGKVFANCGWLEDTITVQASISKAILDLGEDTTICAGNSYVLRAGAGFGSYLWQDGSTDSVFVVKQPGRYSVKVTSCGNTLTDSVFVRAAPPISFDAGPDRTKCNADTLHLTAPAGFLNYSWSNNYKISSLSSSTVIVNPLVDTSYFVKAEKTPGCYVYDTVRITVNTSPSIDLGRDTSFCTGDSMVLRAANGFQTYEWNNGSKSHQLAVRTTGSYSVIGTTSQGCKSFDTLKITEVLALPLVSLNKTPGLCMGESRTLDAGSFISYLWQDGSKGKTFMIRDTGRYYVKVTDKNGCKGGDTVIIKSLFSLPEKFLPADTFLCSYEKLELKSRLNYKDYLWNTGGNKPSIIVTQPGTYWLQVYDSNNCKGNISVTIRSKDCMVGFYVPSAFTPNGDGKNDLFRPLLYVM